MSRRFLWLLAALMGLTASVFGELLDKEQLRQMAKLPTVNLMFSFGVDSLNGFTSEPTLSAAEATAQITAIKKTQSSHTADAAWYDRLGDLYGQAKDTNAAMRAYAKAAGLYQRQLKTQPDDAAIWLAYGAVLGGAGKPAEAETAMRQAVKVAPQNAAAWLQLGNFLSGRAAVTLLPSLSKLNLNEMPVDGVPFHKTIAAVTEHPPTSEARAKAQRLIAEADDCFDKAVVVAPQKEESYIKRYANRTFVHAWFRAALEKQPASPLFLFAPDAMGDLRRAAQLGSEDYLAQRYCVITEFLYEIYRQRLHLENLWDAWDKLPGDTRKRIHEAEARLVAVSVSVDKTKAGGAAEALGIFQYFLHGDSTNSVATLRRAVAIDPTREQAWDMLLGILFTSQHTNDMLVVCQQRLVATPSVRNHLLLAKVWDMQGRQRETEAQVRAALKLGPKDVLVNLAQAAMSVRCAHDAAGLRRAAQHLAAVAKLMNDDTPREQQADLAVLQCIHAALSGQTNKARQHIERALRLDPNNDHAKNLLKFKALRPAGDSA